MKIEIVSSKKSSDSSLPLPSVYALPNIRLELEFFYYLTTDTFALMTIEELYSIYLKHPEVCTDSRAITKDCLFFALKGEHFNGNTFAASALEKGAAFAVVDEPAFVKGERIKLVKDVLETLQQLANHHRRQLKIPFIAITGSNGKTTTKELIRNVLSKKFRTHATKGNLNNHIGVPLTILSIKAGTEMAVIEMGANHLLEIKMLCEIAEPDYGLITNIGKAHLEGFGGFEGVKKGKGELDDFIVTNNGTIFLNADNTDLVEMANQKKISKRITFGSSHECQCRGHLQTATPFVKIRWEYSEQQSEVSSQLIGSYNFENILASICIGNYFGVDEKQINEAIEEYVPGNSRSQVIRKGTNMIILDAYNANPTSVSLALKNFNEIQAKHKIIFLGDMAELGAESEKEHAATIDLLKSMKPDELILVGKNFSRFANQLPCHYFESSAEAANWVKTHPFTDSAMLIKGSRSVQMEKVLEGI